MDKFTAKENDRRYAALEKLLGKSVADEVQRQDQEKQEKAMTKAIQDSVHNHYAYPVPATGEKSFMKQLVKEQRPEDSGEAFMTTWTKNQHENRQVPWGLVETSHGEKSTSESDAYDLDWIYGAKGSDGLTPDMGKALFQIFENALKSIVEWLPRAEDLIRKAEEKRGFKSAQNNEETINSVAMNALARRLQ